MPDPSLAGPLRAALVAADYTYDAVAALLGPTAHAALGRNETTAGERVTRGGSPLETLVRLWLLQLPDRLTDLERALPGLVDRLCAEGLLNRSISEVAARLDVRPYAVSERAGQRALWVVSDLTPGLDGAPSRVSGDTVLGISPAATSLAQLTDRSPVRRALDLGTGSGVQSLHLATHADAVVATDVNPRALDLSRFTAALNEVGDRVEVREGSFFEPVRDERFDLVVSNPPFVISPAVGERLVYRDSGLPGDRAVEHLVRAVPDHLTEGGTCQLMANWLVLEHHPWQERLAGWFDDPDTPVDAWVIQRETTDLPTYVELWLKDAGVHPSTGGDPQEYRRRYDTWLSWFAEQGAEAVGFGWINLRRTDGTPDVRVEDWPYEVALPLGDEVARHFAATGTLRRTSDEALLASRLVAPSDVHQETLGVPGAEDPSTILLRRQSGVRRALQADTATAALVGACDGDLTLGQIRDALSTLDVAPPSTDAVRELVRDGFLGLSPAPASSDRGRPSRNRRLR